MSLALEIFSAARSDHSPRVLGQQLYPDVIPTPFDDHIKQFDAEICASLNRLHPGLRAVTYDQATEALPNMIFQDDVLNRLILWAGQTHNPNRITSAGLQVGKDAILHIHRLHWDSAGDYFVVSSISRYSSSCEMGHSMLEEYHNIWKLYKAHSQAPPLVKQVVDVVEPIIQTSSLFEDDVHPTFFTVFDESRGGLHATALASTQDFTHMGHILNYVLPFTEQMTAAMRQQLGLMDIFTGKDSRYPWQVAELAIAQQWADVAFGLATLAFSARYLPKNVVFPAGDLMGTIFPGARGVQPRISELKLVSVKGGLVAINNEAEILKVLRTYTMPIHNSLNADYDVGVFSMLSDMQLALTIEAALNFVR